MKDFKFEKYKWKDVSDLKRDFHDLIRSINKDYKNSYKYEAINLKADENIIISGAENSFAPEIIFHIHKKKWKHILFCKDQIRYHEDAYITDDWITGSKDYVDILSYNRWEQGIDSKSKKITEKNSNLIDTICFEEITKEEIIKNEDKFWINITWIENWIFDTNQWWLENIFTSFILDIEKYKKEEFLKLLNTDYLSSNFSIEKQESLIKDFIIGQNKEFWKDKEIEIEYSDFKKITWDKFDLKLFNIWILKLYLKWDIKLHEYDSIVQDKFKIDIISGNFLHDSKDDSSKNNKSINNNPDKVVYKVEFEDGHFWIWSEIKINWISIKRFKSSESESYKFFSSIYNTQNNIITVNDKHSKDPSILKNLDKWLSQLLQEMNFKGINIKIFFPTKTHKNIVFRSDVLQSDIDWLWIKDDFITFFNWRWDKEIEIKIHSK